MRKLFVLATVALTMAGVVVPAVSARSVGDPYCGIRWGSLPERDLHYTSAPITDLRAGRHRCFDRLVVDLGPRVAGLPGLDSSGYQVQYVPLITQDGSGQPQSLAGGALLSIVVHAPAHDGDYNPTYAPADPAHAVAVGGFRTFRQVAYFGTFEGQTTLGLGVRARLPFRVFVLSRPGDGSRVVIDVAHRW
jgi:hypothetical protein